MVVESANKMNRARVRAEMRKKKMMKANKMNKLVASVAAGTMLGLSGCSSTLYKPEIVQAAPKKDGVFFVDLRNGPWSIDDSAVKTPVAKLLKENCTLAQNINHPVCQNPRKFVLYNGQLRNAIWGKGPVFMATFVPKSLNAKGVAQGRETDGDIVRGKIIPGPVSLLAYDGIIERHDDPNRACKWEGTHNYSGGVVCPKYGYDYKQLDVSKL